MSKLSLIIIMLVTYLVTSIATASHIQPKKLSFFPVQTVALTPNGTAQVKDKSHSEFERELQWRILNLLAQQLFDDSHDTLTRYLFSSSWIYQTSTFAVNISAINPDFLEVKITDLEGSDETRLEIPRL